MNAIQLLKDDHKKVKKMFRDYEKQRSDDKKKEIADQVLMELEVHAQIEEEIFYPAVRSKSQKSKIVTEAAEEHHVADVIIAELKKTRPGEQFDAKFKVLAENVEHHIEEEETQMLPDAETKLKGELDELGQRMMKRKEQLMAVGARR